MALIKTKTNEQGVEYNYWIPTVNSSAKTKKSQIIMEGYVSKEARNNGANFIERRDEGRLNIQYPTGEEVYTYLTTSRITKERIVDEEGKTVLGEDGKPTYTEIENNWFADAVSDLE